MSNVNTSSESLECCRRGEIHSGNSVGKTTSIAGIDAYFTAAPSGSPSGALLYITDAMGWEIPNARLLADTYAAEANIDVYMPNFLAEMSLTPSVLKAGKVDMQTWAKKSIERRPQHHDEIHNVLKELKFKYPKIAASGYCWGGFYSIRLATHEDVIDCAIASHPSLVEVPKDIEDVKKPILFVCAEEDSQFGDEKREKTKEVLTQKGVGAEFQYYPGTTHGWTVRGETTGPVAGAAKKAKDDTVNFIRKHFGVTN
ncbi:hypothetical protein INT43_004823 [Umbelopsis isabellina]|uniref:Dienelactone hydrolase domain-containing protein n=1 Tax=Mortierella isabellina TaxID=91625 RepID=A0A8H7U8M7_MORIS|nr:hypothetical protein INT43_004823 [Umbelopsis isabellina]